MRDFFIKIGLALLAYYSPLYELFVVMLLFVAADLITGIAASHRRGIPRSSRRLRKSVVKLVCYLSAMMLAFTAEAAFKVEWFAAHRVIGAFICSVEFISILENFAVITGRPVFLKLVKWIRGKASDPQNIVNEIVNEKNEFFTGDGVHSADGRVSDTATGDNKYERQSGYYNYPRNGSRHNSRC